MDEPYNLSTVDLDEYVNNFKPVSNTDEEDVEEVSHNIQMIQNAIDFKNVKLRECMVPRIDVKAIELNEKIEKLNKILTETGHSKIVVYKDTIDNIVGYVHARDIFKTPDSIKSILRPIEVFPETMAANEFLSELIKSKKSIAIVLDEFGGTSGIITIEDVIEEIFGEIEDEFDQEGDLEIKINDNEYQFSARLEIDYLNKKYQLGILENDEYETLAGFILYHHHNIPKLNESIIIDQFNFTISEVNNTRIEAIHLTITN